MRIKDIRYDKEVKPFWRNGINTLWYAALLLGIPRVMLKMYNKNNNGKYAFGEEFIGWSFLCVALLFLFFIIAYWVKPSLFKKNKE